MRLGTMFGDVIRSLFRRPVTEEYPFTRRTAPPQLRGKLRADLSACTGCGLCAMDCPADAIEVITLDKKARRFVIRYRLDRCTFCGQCVESCRKNCLGLSPVAWELATSSKKPLTVYFGKEEDINEVLAGGPLPGDKAIATQ